MEIFNTLALSFLSGVIIYLLTALLLGTRRTANLPGGAVGSAIMFSPIYLSIPAALLGHFTCVLIATKLKF